MKFGYLALLVVGGIVAGCVTRQPDAKFSDPTALSGTEAGEASATAIETAAISSQPSSEKPKLLVTPESRLLGSVVTFNQAGRFVVLDFPPGRMPSQEQTLFVYRQGLKVGEVRVTGPERDHNTVADLTSGEAAKGDEVRDQ